MVFKKYFFNVPLFQLVFMLNFSVLKVQLKQVFFTLR